MCHPKKLFESNPCLIDFCHVIPLSNCHSELSCLVNNHIIKIHGLNLCVQSTGDVGKIEEFFNGGEYGGNQVSRVVGHLLENIIVFRKLVGHEMTIVVLEVSQHVRHSVID